MKQTVQSLNDDDESVPLGMLEGTVSYALKRAYLRTIRDLEAALAPLAFTPPLLAALSIIAANPGLAPARLADAMGHGRSRAAPLVDRLAADGLVERRAGADRRTLGLWPTSAGLRTLRRLAPAVRAHEARVTAGLEGEAKRLASALGRILPG